MEILNIGPLEFLLVLVLMFILLGPKDMVKTAQNLGKTVRKLIRSPLWSEIRGYSREIRELPTKLVRESGLEEEIAEIREAKRETLDAIRLTPQDISGEEKLSFPTVGEIANEPVAPEEPSPMPFALFEAPQHSATTESVNFDSPSPVSEVQETTHPKIERFPRRRPTAGANKRRV